MTLRIVAIACRGAGGSICSKRVRSRQSDSYIDAVTVYPQGARVTRLARVRLARRPEPGGADRACRAASACEGVQVDAVSGDVEVRAVEIDLVRQRDAYNTENEPARGRNCGNAAVELP